MRALFDLHHPAHVHLFKHAIWELEARGHETMVTARDKEVTLALLDALDIDHVRLSTQRDSVAGNAVQLARHEARLFGVASRFDPDVLVSRLSPSVLHVARLQGRRSVVVTDTNVGTSPLGRVYNAVTLPFLDVLCAPAEFDVPGDHTNYTLDFQELAYLHPDRFTPDATRLAEHGVAVDEPYSVIRLAGWDAYHDVGRHGLSVAGARELLDRLSERGPVYISSERELPAAFAAHELTLPPYLVHDLLHFAELYVGDSGTMSTEAALLGTPAVRTNSAAGVDDEWVFRALEHEYGLLFSFADEGAAVAKVSELLGAAETKQTWLRRRDRVVDAYGDVTGQMVEVIVSTALGDGPMANAADTERGLRWLPFP